MYYTFIALILLNILIVVGAEMSFSDFIVSLTSHNKIVICNVAEHSINSDYNIDGHDLNLCTHLFYFPTDQRFFNEKDSSNSRDFFHSLLDHNEYTKYSLNGIRHKYPHLRIFFGLNQLPSDFLQIICDPAMRKIFIEKAVHFIQNHNFDGLDLNCVFPKQSETDQLLSFVRELKDFFDWNALQLTSSLDAKSVLLDDGDYLKSLCTYFDLVHITQHYPNSSVEYYSVARALDDRGIENLELVLNRLMQLGVPPSKVAIEINVGGLRFDTASRTRTYLGYNQICELLSNETHRWNEQYDSTHGFSIAKKNDGRLRFWRHVIVFEDKRSILNRIRLAMKVNLSGVVANFINTDDISGNCKVGDEKFDDFQSPHVSISLGISANDTNVNLVKYMNMMMVLALLEIDQEVKLSHEPLILA